MVTPSWRIILGGSSKHFMALVKICSFLCFTVLHYMPFQHIEYVFLQFGDMAHVWRWLSQWSVSSQEENKRQSWPCRNGGGGGNFCRKNYQDDVLRIRSWPSGRGHPGRTRCSGCRGRNPCTGLRSRTGSWKGKNNEVHQITLTRPSRLCETQIFRLLQAKNWFWWKIVYLVSNFW